MTELSVWNGKMTKQLTILVAWINNVINTWEEFQKKNLRYFDDTETTLGEMLGSERDNDLPREEYIEGIDKYFAAMKTFRRRLEGLKSTLDADRPTV